jgi:predicted PurR-regulated permease PerM
MVELDGVHVGSQPVVMVVFLTYFMLLSDQLFKRKLVEIVGTSRRRRRRCWCSRILRGQIEQFIKIQLLTSTAVALVTWGALWALGLQQAALWGLLAGIFNSIPYYGPLLVTAGLSIVAYLQFGTVSMTAAVAGVSLLITTLEGFLLTPLLIGRASSMNQVAVFGGLLFWSWVWGVWGILLAVPMMMVIKVICDHVEPLQPVGHLLVTDVRSLVLCLVPGPSGTFVPRTDQDQDGLSTGPDQDRFDRSSRCRRNPGCACPFR